MSRTVILKSSDGKLFTVNETAAFLSPTIKKLCKEHRDSNEVQILNVEGKFLASIIKFCQKYVADTSKNKIFTPLEVNIDSTDHDFQDFFQAAEYLELYTFANIRYFKYHGHGGKMGLLLTPLT